MGNVEIGLLALAITIGLAISLLFTLNLIVRLEESKSPPPRDVVPVFPRHDLARLNRDIDLRTTKMGRTSLG